MTDNPFDLLLLVIYVGYFFAALFAYQMIKIFGFKGLLFGLITNAVIHANMIYNGERLLMGHPPELSVILRQLAFFVIVNLIVMVVTFYITSKKGYPREILTALGLFLSSIFFVEFYVPAIYLLIMLTLPFKNSELSDHA